jgi:hypothetical protein
MKKVKLPLLLMIFLMITTNLRGQYDYKVEVGIDFVRFTRNWIYYNTYYHPISTPNYLLETVPSIFFRFPKQKYSLRLKYEFFKGFYYFKSGAFDINSTIDSKYNHNRFLFGAEKVYLNKRLKATLILDIGTSLSHYYGLYNMSSQGVPAPINPEFNFTSLGISLQPGLGFKFEIFKNLYANLESSIAIEKSIEPNDIYNINPDSKFIPRPISLFGLSYTFRPRN